MTPSCAFARYFAQLADSARATLPDVDSNACAFNGRPEFFSRVLKKVGEGFGDQVAQILRDCENRSKAYWRYASRGSQESTTEMGRLGAEAPSIPFQR